MTPAPRKKAASPRKKAAARRPAAIPPVIPEVEEPVAADAPAEVPVEEIEDTESDLLSRGRAMLGVTGREGKEPLLKLLRRHHLGLYPVIALGLLAFVDGFQSLVIGTLGPEISRGLGISAGGLAGLVLLKQLALALTIVLMAEVVGRRAIRAAVSIVTAFAWSIATVFTGLVRTPAGMAGVNVLDGASSGSVAACHTPLLLDSYPPEVRIRVNSLRTGFIISTGVAAPLLVTLLVAGFDLTWRGVLVVLGVVSVIVSCFAIGLRDPGYGKWDTQRVRELVQAEEGEGESPDTEPLTEDPKLGFFEAARRLWLIPSMRKAIVITTISSAGGVPVQIYFTFFLADRWGLGPAARGVFGSVVALLGVALLFLFAPLGDRMFRRSPAQVIELCTIVNAIAAVLGVLAIISPFFAPMVLFYGISQSMPQAIGPVVGTTFMNIVPARQRSALIGLLTIAATFAGGTLGTLLLSGLDKRIGITGALLAVSALAPITLFMLWSIRKDINRDMDATVRAVIEQEELETLHRKGVRPPLLSCRHIDFSYGQLQVLFDVDFTVDDGEMVALLGTNGAGKSTLLNVISGINLPSAGSVRLRGADITYVDAERRVHMGVSQVLGGKATFGPMSVVENLRTYGFAHGRSKAVVDRGIDEAFAAFPRLAERRNQLAQTLSGGEQQMLGLSQALILKPQLLCIDELSLGLAPKIVGELLAMVRQINDSGTAVVLVEQSATIALSLVDHAYFMERGEIRFDGPATELIGRDDLLRSVFLRGAGGALAGAGPKS